ncbi:MAG: hypothetical protein U0414_40465 [Polyangiaceae bacterium]
MDRARRASLLCCIAALLTACAADAPSVETIKPARRDRVPFTDYAIAGTHLFLHRDLGDSQCNDCESRSYVEGESLLGEPLPTVKVFLMAGRLEAADLARRAMDILLSRAGEPVLTAPGPDANCHEEPPVCALIAPPKIEGDTLSFWINEGEMSPTLTRVEVDLNTADVKRTRGADLAH